MRTSTAKWLERELGKRNRVLLVLRHHGSGANSLLEYSYESGKEEITAEDLAARFEDAARDDAEGLSGVQKYAILACDDGGSKRWTARHILTINATEEFAADDWASESPNVEGITRQQMRHNEAIMRTASAANSSVVMAQARLIDALMARLEKHDELQADFFERLRRVSLDEEARRAEAYKITRDADDRSRAIAEVVKAVKPLAGIAANKLILKGGGSPVGGALEEIARGLLSDPGKARKVIEALAPVLAQDEMARLLGAFDAEIDAKESAKSTTTNGKGRGIA